jgi:hypothetical protein
MPGLKAEAVMAARIEAEEVPRGRGIKNMHDDMMMHKTKTTKKLIGVFFRGRYRRCIHACDRRNRRCHGALRLRGRRRGDDFDWLNDGAMVVSAFRIVDVSKR